MNAAIPISRSRSRSAKRLPAPSLAPSPAQVHRDALLEKVSVAVGHNLECVGVTRTKFDLDAFRKMLHSNGANLSDDDSQFLFTQMASIDGASFVTEMAMAAKAAASRRTSADDARVIVVSSSTPPPDTFKLLQLLADAVDRSGMTILECFKQVDFNQDGKINMGELEKVMSMLLAKEGGAAVERDALLHVFAMMDRSCDGTVDLGDFSAAIAKAKSAKCPLGHFLVRHTNTISPGVMQNRWCDGCHKTIAFGAYIMGCRVGACNFDLCDGCLQKAAVVRTSASITITRHVYNARGGAPPYRGSYLTATDEVKLELAKTLAEQIQKIIPPSGTPPHPVFGRPASVFGTPPTVFGTPPIVFGAPAASLGAFPAVQEELYLFKGIEAPRKWDFAPGAMPPRVDPSKKASEIFGGEQNPQIAVLIPMTGMD